MPNCAINQSHCTRGVECSLPMPLLARLSGTLKTQGPSTFNHTRSLRERYMHDVRLADSMSGYSRVPVDLSFIGGRYSVPVHDAVCQCTGPERDYPAADLVRCRLRKALGSTKG